MTASTTITLTTTAAPMRAAAAAAAAVAKAEAAAAATAAAVIAAAAAAAAVTAATTAANSPPSRQGDHLFGTRLRSPSWVHRRRLRRLAGWRHSTFPTSSSGRETAASRFNHSEQPRCAAHAKRQIMAAEQPMRDGEQGSATTCLGPSTLPARNPRHTAGAAHRPHFGGEAPCLSQDSRHCRHH